MAAAPSFILDELPAVTVPSFWNAGLNVVSYTYIHTHGRDTLIYLHNLLAMIAHIKIHVSMKARWDIYGHLPCLTSRYSTLHHYQPRWRYLSDTCKHIPRSYTYIHKLHTYIHTFAKTNLFQLKCLWAIFLQRKYSPVCQEYRYKMFWSQRAKVTLTLAAAAASV